MVAEAAERRIVVGVACFVLLGKGRGRCVLVNRSRRPHELPRVMANLTAARRSASPRRWARSQKSRWRWTSAYDALSSIHNCKNERYRLPRLTDSGRGSATGTDAHLRGSGVALRVFLHRQRVARLEDAVTLAERTAPPARYLGGARPRRRVPRLLDPRRGGRQRPLRRVQGRQARTTS